MREIKFRAWDKQNKSWIEDTFLIMNCGTRISVWPDGNHCQSYALFIGFDIKLSQYTGLKDKNGKEIYEGDILFGREEGDGETTAWTDVYYEVLYDTQDAIFVCKDINYKNRSWDCMLCDICDEYEVIGNIYESSDILDNIDLKA